MTDPAAPLLTFTGTDRFQPVALLGRGSMGVVYRVHDKETGTDVALKTFAVRDPGELYRLKSEFRSLADVVHRNLVELYELFVDDRACFFTMELVDGISFVEYARGTSGVVDYGRLTDALRQLVSGLAAIHAEGKLHRDVKPSNVLVTSSGRVVVLDFGLVTVLAGARAGDTQPGLVGTLAYMAPEQAWGKEPNPTADWYSVGVMLYEALTGRVPFEGPAARMLADKGRSVPPGPRTLVPEIPENLDALVVALLDPAPVRRPGADHVLGQLHNRPGVVAQSRDVRPARGDGQGVPFVGRTAELAELQRDFAALANRKTRVVLVEGPSGIGKSELVRRFLRIVEGDERTVVLDGRCHPYEAVPYKAVDSLVDTLSRFLMALPEFSVGALVPRNAAALTRLFPVLARVPALATWHETEDAVELYELRRRGFAALRELLARIGDRQSLLLWIDDLQWGDADSAVLLRELLLPPDPPVMLLVLSYRSEDHGSGSLLETFQASLADLPADGLRRVVLSPLSSVETHELAAQLCATSADERVAAIAAEANGSPFLVTQLAHHAATQLTTSAIFPSSLQLQTMLAERIEGLGASAQELLELVSIAGQPLDRSVALEAAGIGEQGRSFIGRLEHEGLLRTAPRDVRRTVEVYHDRIREVIVGQVPKERIRIRHRQLAETIERQPDPDPDALFRHYLGAEDRERAGDWAVCAADRAAEALAFVRAADLYRQALVLKPDAAQAGRLELRRGEALANAGRGGEAGQVFEAAAARAAVQPETVEQVLALKGRAADQYLRSGVLDQGTRLLHEVLSAAGIALPQTNSQAMLQSLTTRVRFLWRGLRFTARAADAIPIAARMRLTSCWAGAAGLSLVDPLGADSLGVRAAIMALDAGDLKLINMTLGHEAAKEASFGIPFFTRHSERIVALLERTTRESGDPYVEAGYHRAVGMSAYFGARWRVALEHCDRAAAIWRDQCRGTAWETMILHSFSVSALAYLGELRELGRRLPELLADCDARGDVHGATSLRMGVPAMLWLAEDRAHEARELAEQLIRRWPAHTFLVQHYLHLVSTVQADLYLGDAWQALRRMEEAWPRLVRAQILRVVSTRVELHHLRARVALAAAAARPDQLPDGAAPPDPAWPRARLLRQARAAVKQIRRDRLPTCAPFVAAIRAGLARADGRDQEAIGLLADAVQGFAAADMRLYAAAAKLAGATLQGGDAGHAARLAAAELMQTEGVQNPPLMADLLCPMADDGPTRKIASTLSSRA